MKINEKAVAYHEAGHCIAAFLTHKRFRVVSVVPDGESLGKLLHIPWKNFHPDYEENRRTIHKAKTGIFMILAGLASEKKFMRRRKSGGSSDEDLKKAYGLADNLCGSWKVSKAYIDFMWEQTKNIIGIDRNWKAIEIIARTLLKKKIVRYQEARRLVREVSGEVIPPIDLL
jgi:ATP-dependent Zn protease